MHCSRCQGLMMEEYLLDMEGGFGEMWTTSLRCINCGHVHDSAIEQHRVARQKKLVTLAGCKSNDLDQGVHLGVEPIIRQAA
jgi:uncharacterized Zn finger protein